MTTNKINPRQQRFVEEYLIDFNATKAAIRAGYAPKRADAVAYKLLRIAEIQVLVAEKQWVIAERLDITQERTVLEIARLAFSDLRKAFDENGNLLPVGQWPDDIAAAISSIKVNELLNDDGSVTQTKEIKLWDKGSAQERLSKYLGLYEKDNEQKINPLADLLKSLHENNRGLPANANP